MPCQDFQPQKELCNSSQAIEIPVEEKNVATEEDDFIRAVDDEQCPIESQLPIYKRYHVRNRKPPARLQDYVVNVSKHPLITTVSPNDVSSAHCAFLATVDNVNEPSTFDEAQSSPIWQKAMTEELDALHSNNT
ncbi:uncharacterized protein LOC125369770 [Ricinus communis]|uniref:uncharacterized protein LOC125369770 n=1 Tax=Ricinus communis TaxID=3988 RepID=UPI00201AE5FB|nr:uncharacterized protein LOC125369770 [Ricinus communis]